MKKEIQIKWQDDQIIINGFNELVEVLSKTKEVRYVLTQVEEETQACDELPAPTQPTLFESVMEDFVEVNEQTPKKKRNGGVKLYGKYGYRLVMHAPTTGFEERPPFFPGLEKILKSFNGEDTPSNRARAKTRIKDYLQVELMKPENFSKRNRGVIFEEETPATLKCEGKLIYGITNHKIYIKELDR